MTRTYMLLLAATLVMAGLDWSGAAQIPWLVVLTPILVPFLAWLAISALAIAVFAAAPIIALMHRIGGKR